MSRNRIGIETSAPPSDDGNYGSETGRDGSNRRSRSTDDVSERKNKKPFSHSRVNVSERLIAAREKALPTVGKYEPVDVSRFKQPPARKALDPKKTPRIGWSGLSRAMETTQHAPKPQVSRPPPPPPPPSYVSPGYEPYILNYMNSSGFIHSIRDKRKDPDSRSPDPYLENRRSSPETQLPRSRLPFRNKIPSRPWMDRKRPNRKPDVEPEEPMWGRQPRASPVRHSPIPRPDSSLDHPRNSPLYPNNVNNPYQSPTLPSPAPEYHPDRTRSPSLPETPDLQRQRLVRTPSLPKTPELRRQQLDRTPAKPETPDLNWQQLVRTPTPPVTPELNGQEFFRSPTPPEAPELHEPQLDRTPAPPKVPTIQYYMEYPNPSDPTKPYREEVYFPTPPPDHHSQHPAIHPSIAVPVSTPLIYDPPTREQPDGAPPPQTKKPNQVEPLQPTSLPKKDPPSQPTLPRQATPPQPASHQKQATPPPPSPSQPHQAMPKEPSFPPKQATPPQISSKPKQATPPQPASQPKQATPKEPPFPPKQTTPPKISSNLKQATLAQLNSLPKQATPSRAAPPKYPSQPKYAPPTPREIRQSKPAAPKYTHYDPPPRSPPTRRIPRPIPAIPEVKVSRPYEPYYDLSSPLPPTYYPFDDDPPRNYRSRAGMSPDYFGYPEHPRKAARPLDRLPDLWYRKDSPDPLPPLTTYYPPTLGVEKAGLYEMGTITRSMAMYRHPGDMGSWRK